MLRRLAPVACALTLMGFGATAAAQDAPTTASPPLALSRFYPAPAGDRLFGVQSPYVAGDLTPHFSIVADYAHNPLVLRTVNTGEDRGTIVSDQLLMHFQGGLAIKNRLFVNVSFPIALLQSGGSPAVGGTTFSSPQDADIGDLRLGLRVRLLGDYWDPFQLAIGGYFWIPTAPGLDNTYLGNGGFRGLPQVIVGGRIAERVVWSFNIGPDIRGSQVFGGATGVTQGTMFRIDAGAGVLLDDARNLQVGLEANAGINLENQTDDPINRASNVEVLLGGKYRFLNDFEAGLGVGPGLSSGIGTPDVRVVGSIAYTPQVKKEEPPKDSDGDGILDPQDACPTVKGLPNADAKLNGCPDTDGDGIFDAQDACPQVKGVPNQDPTKNGCPADTDGDGILDADDACPTVAGVANPDPKLNGCPDKDGDGVLDAVDACPDIKGIKTEDPKTNGCPGDTDGDTIRDDKDACPNEKGKPDPDPTKNGCPQAVRVTETEIIILQQVQFDTNKATIKKVSDALLDEVAEVLREHPELLKLEVQGHTDNKGTPKGNDKLSQDRAESVKKALIKRGISEGRLVPKGYGQNKPIADNNTDEGRQKNRRVQFVILEKTTKDKAPPPDKAPATTTPAPKGPAIKPKTPAPAPAPAPKAPAPAPKKK